MLAFFPSIHKDELLYSALTRYHNRSGNLNIKDSAFDLFGKRKAYIIPDLPTDLERLFNRVKTFTNSGINEWIDNHTLYNYYTNFNSKEIKKNVRDKMLKSSEYNSIHYSTGQMAGTVKEPMYFRYCPKCLDEDLNINGESFWRTYHQLPSVYTCLEHFVLLEESSVLMRQGNSLFFHPNVENCSMNKRENNFSKIDIELLHHFSAESYKLNCKDYEFEQLNLLEIYHYLLRREGYVKSNGTIDQKRLEGDFIKKYKNNFLRLMQSFPSGVDGSCWLKGISRKHRKVFHPVRHLLLIYFLNETIDTINQYANKFYCPFGDGLYLCLNPAAEHYLKPVITNLKVTWCSDTKKPVGTFTCTCGFIYSRRGPDITSDDKIRIGRIKNFGATWLQKLEQLIEKDRLSYRAISKILKVDTNTIIKYSKLRNRQPKIRQHNKCDSKQRWLDLMNQHPNLSKTELRKKNPSLYMRIYRIDKEWLRKNSPITKRSVGTYKRVDWEKRDLQLLSEVKRAVEDLSTREKPVRVTVSSISKAINQKSLLEKKADKLPLTFAYINTVKENVTDFQKRRIKWSVNELEDEEIEVWKIMRKAGIRESFYTDVSEEILLYVNNKKY